MKKQFYSSAAIVALSVPGMAFAQSTGSVEFDKEIVVTATSTGDVGGVQVPDSSKAKGVLTQEIIARQTPGNSILNTINNLPGVNFQNNDPFGSAGGTLSIRGFDSSRIALTFDGVPLNDSGGYAIFSNQQLDPELIENVNVNYGSTDVDSPSAGASGSTVNYRTRKPSDDFAVRILGSGGDFNFMRIFAAIDTGEITSSGTKAFFSASRATNDWFVNNFGKISKKQANARIYQPLGDGGDFISIAGHYNQNRNNFGGSAPLRSDTNIFSQSILAPNNAQNPLLVTGAVRTAGTGAATNRFPISQDEIPYSVARCTLANGVAGAADPANICGTSFDERYNPSNTGNIRLNSRFTLADGLVLTVDPSFQYVKANGGGTASAREFLRDINPAGATAGSTNVANCTTVNTGAGVLCRPGYLVGSPFVGRDLNGDGDALDTVTVLAPSQTQTNRYGVLASLRYQVSEGQSVRLTYSYDRARHRQTGEIGFLQANGAPEDVFPVNNGIAANNEVLQKRDRLSFAILNQVSGEYRGEFLDSKLIATIGVRAPFYKRDLTNYCFSSNATGNVECFGRSAALQAELAGFAPYNPNPTTGVPAAGNWSPPQNRVYKYNKILPNVGVVFKPIENWSIFANFSKGIQVPGTDNLYNAFFFPVGSEQANPVPETTSNFDGGVRYTSNRVQASISPWFTRFTNRLAGAFDPETSSTVYRNLGTVDKYGIDGSISIKPVKNVVAYIFGSYLKSKIKNDVQLGTCPATLTTANTTINCTVAGAPIFAATAGKRESAASVYSIGARLAATIGPVELGTQIKRYGKRYINDQNLPVIGCTAALINTLCPTVANTPATFTGTRGIQFQAYTAAAPAYTIIDLDARIKLDWAGLNDKTYLQFNLQNPFNKFYVGGFNGGSTILNTVPFAQIGAPRTFIATLNVAF